MSNLTDPKFLQEHQYRRADNLEARIRLHREYTVPAVDWQAWVFDQLALSGGEKVLEVGCGPASLWRENASRLPDGLSAALGDLSWGMADQARRNMAGAPGLRYLALDAQAIPFPDGHFDVVVANHMLYHVPDLARGVGELRRVLRPGGRLFAATNGMQHMQKLFELVYAFDARARKADDFQKRFCLENVGEVLGRSFERVKVVPFESRLEVTAVAPLMDYILSMSSFWGVFEGQMPRLEQFLAERMAAEGKIVIPKVAGLAIAD